MAGPSPDTRRTAPPFPWWGVAGVALFGAGLWVLLADVPVWNTTWYLAAWYGYLLVLDAVLLKLQGRSFLCGGLRELGAMLLWSVPFWFVFEAYNLVLQNWYYVFGLRAPWARGAYSFAAFATVLPACFFHAEVLRALGFPRRGRGRRLAVGPGLEAACIVLGAACCVAPLLWPRYAFPLVWGAPLFLPEVLNRRLGAPSLLADLERGDRRRLLRLLAGGLAAGVAWELFNYPARTKWIYTVPGFEELKLFEMPLAGFGGFPVLAVGAFSSYSLLCHLLRGGRSWEGEVQAGRRPAPSWLYAVTVAAALAASYAVLGAMERSTLHSRRPLLRELVGLDPEAAGRLEAAGVPTPERLARTAGPGGTEALALDTGVSPGTLTAAARHARLALHKGMGAPKARLLLAAGIRSPAGLVDADPEALHRRLVELASTRDLPRPRRAEVAVWVRAARPDGRPRR